MKDTARRLLLRSFIEFLGAVLCLLALVAALAFTRASFGALCAFLLGFMLLIVDGVVSLTKSRKVRQFK